MTAAERDQSRAVLRQKLDAVTPEQHREFFQAGDQSASSATPPVDDTRAAEIRNRVLSVLSEEERKTLDTYHAKLNERVKERGITTPVNFF